MSPEIRKVNGNLIARVPDETGIYKTLKGNTLYVNTDQVEASAKKQTIVLESDEIGGKRVLGLTHQGTGRSWDHKRGDGKEPKILVSLLDKPIRVTYSTLIMQDPMYDPLGLYDKRGPRQTVKNPRWVRSNEQR